MTRVVRFVKSCIRYLEDMSGNASKSNSRGYAATGLEASLHNLLTSARLWRVLKHCTWEKTTVARSMPGSKIGCLVSGAIPTPLAVLP